MENLWLSRSSNQLLSVSVVCILIPILLLVVLRQPRRSPVRHNRKRTFRIFDIPENVTRDELCNEILRCLPLSDSDSKPSLSLTFAKSSDRYRIASFTSYHGLKALPSFPYQHDDLFYGITPLVAPDNATVDIIALPGLGSHAIGGFSGHNDKMWLRDFLPEDIPEARIIVYGYDSRVDDKYAQRSIVGLSKSFLDSFKAFRSATKTDQRPIIYVAHSLGGLLVKEALSIALEDETSPASTDLFKSSYGLIFFGVPNLGLDLGQLRELTSGQPNKNFIADLYKDDTSEPTQYLESLSHRFIHVCKKQSPSFNILSYCEEMMTPTAVISKDGKLIRGNERRFVVTRSSAFQIGAVDNFHQQQAINADHRNLVKFSTRNGDYARVMNGVKDLVLKASDVVKGRFGNNIDKLRIVSQLIPLVSPVFYGRETELLGIDAYFEERNAKQRCAVLSGIAGSGKTQLALHYWNSYSLNYSSRIWIDASSLATVLASFSEAALLANLVTTEGYNYASPKMLISRVKDRLQSCDNSNWLLVIDNVDNLDNDYHLLELIPRCEHGAILITSTQSRTADIIDATTIEVGDIGIAAGSKLLVRRRRSRNHSIEVQELIERVVVTLHGVPLAIEQAGAYLAIRHSISTQGLKFFLDELASPKDHVKIMSMAPKKSEWFYDKNRSVIMTFNLLMDAIVKEDENSSKLLMLSAFLGPGEIPFEFLTRQPDCSFEETRSSYNTRKDLSLELIVKTAKAKTPLLSWLHSTALTRQATDMALNNLEEFCCIKSRMSKDGSTRISYAMHNAIRDWCQISVTALEQDEWAMIAAYQLSNSLDIESMAALNYQVHARHTMFASKILLRTDVSPIFENPGGLYWPFAWTTAQTFAHIMFRQKRYKVAKDLVAIVLNYEKLHYGSSWPCNESSLKTLHLWGAVHWKKGDLDEAADIFASLLDYCEKGLSHYHSLTVEVAEELRKIQYRSIEIRKYLNRALCLTGPDQRPRIETTGEQAYSQGSEIPTIPTLRARLEDPMWAVEERVGYANMLSIGRDWAASVEIPPEFYLSAIVRCLKLNHERGLSCNAWKDRFPNLWLWALKSGDEPLIRILLESKIEFEISNTTGFEVLRLLTGLHRSPCRLRPCSFAHEIFQLILNTGFDIEARFASGETLSHILASTGCLNLIKLIPDFQLSLDCRTKSGSLPLHHAAFLRFRRAFAVVPEEIPEAVVIQLTPNDGDIDSTTLAGGMTLHFACAVGYKSLVDCLLRYGANIQARTQSQMTPLLFALMGDLVVFERDSEISDISNWIVTIESFVADVPSTTERSTSIRLTKCRETIVKALIDAGSDVNATTSSGITPLHMAAWFGNKNLLRLLLLQGADLLALDNRGWHASDYAHDKQHHSILELLENCVDLFQMGRKESGEQTDLINLFTEPQPVQYSLNQDMAEYLLGVEGEESPGLASGEYCAALNRAAEKGDEVLMEKLVSRGSPRDTLHATNDNALYIASLMGFEEVIKILLLEGVNVDTHGEVCNSAIQAALSNGQLAVVKLLLKEGVEIKSQNEILKSAGNEYALEAMKLLLDQCGAEMQITEEVVKAAAGNYSTGDEVMRLLLDQRGEEVQITEEVVKAAAGNYNKGIEVMKLLLDRRGEEVQITEEIVKTAAGNYSMGDEVMKLLLDRRGEEVHITEEVVKAAAGNYSTGDEVMKLLLDRRGEEVKITEEVVKAAAWNYNKGDEVMKLLLDRRGEEVQITEEAVKAAVENYYKGDEVMKLLLDRRGRGANHRGGGESGSGEPL